MSETKGKPQVYSKTKGLYQKVIDNTCARMKSEFVERGISEDVMAQLRALWELNVAKSGALGDSTRKKEVQKEGMGDKSEASNQKESIPGGLGEPVGQVSLPAPGTAENGASTQGVPGASLTGNKRTMEEGPGEERPGKQHVTNSIPQRDGPGEDEDEDDEEPLGSDLDDSEIEALGEQDDLADADSLNKVDESKVKNMVFGQFERVHRSKNKWKVNLKGCVASINGRDYLFKKLTGEMDFS